eukprot:366245-Chlamydomonas_euryale.AAC.9
MPASPVPRAFSGSADTTWRARAACWSCRHAPSMRRCRRLGGQIASHTAGKRHDHRLGPCILLVRNHCTRLDSSVTALLLRLQVDRSNHAAAQISSLAAGDPGCRAERISRRLPVI